MHQYDLPELEDQPDLLEDYGLDLQKLAELCKNNAVMISWVFRPNIIPTVRVIPIVNQLDPEAEQEIVECFVAQGYTIESEGLPGKLVILMVV